MTPTTLGGAETECVSSLATPVHATVAISNPAERGATTPVPSPSVSVTGGACGTSARTETVADVLGALPLTLTVARGGGRYAGLVETYLSRSSYFYFVFHQATQNLN